MTLPSGTFRLHLDEDPASQLYRRHHFIPRRIRAVLHAKNADTKAQPRLLIHQDTMTDKRSLYVLQGSVCCRAEYLVNFLKSRPESINHFTILWIDPKFFVIQHKEISSLVRTATLAALIDS